MILSTAPRVGHGQVVGQNNGGASQGASEPKAATRIVTVAGLACPCGGTHVRSTGQLAGARVTKVKAKKGAVRVSYALDGGRRP